MLANTSLLPGIVNFISDAYNIKFLSKYSNNFNCIN